MMIRFFFPFRSPSGVCSTFARVAEDLADRCSVETAVLDYDDGYLRRSLKGSAGVKIESFVDGREVDIPDEDVLVLQASSPSSLRRELRFGGRARLVFWQLHPFNFIPNLIPLVPNGSWVAHHPAIYRKLLATFHSAKRRRIIEFITLVSTRHSLFFYEKPSVRLTEELLGVKIDNPILLQIPVRAPETPPRLARLAQDVLRVAWIGRLYNFKIYILLHTLQRFSDYAREHRTRIIFHIVGDGPERRRLNTLDLCHQFFEIRMAGDLDPGVLSAYLVSNVDLVTAMGTSAMEGALAGLPTILLDFSYGTVKSGYRFRWLFDTEEFDLGHAITECDYVRGEDPFPGMMEKIRSSYTTLATRCFDYCVANHGIEQVSDRFLSLVQGSNFRFSELPKKALIKSFARQIHERLSN